MGYEFNSFSLKLHSILNMYVAYHLENVERMLRLSGAEAEQDDESLHSLDLANSIPSPEIIKQSRRVNRRVTLNVGGVR